jgi:drug/metabolite transporter (DMT)-like permease
MNKLNFALIFLQVVMNSAAQVFIKRGVNSIDFKQSLLDICGAIIINPNIFGGVCIFVSALVLWMYLLSQFDLSFLYPLSSLAFIITAFGGWIFLAETITLYRWIGIVLILLGVMCIAKT